MAGARATGYQQFCGLARALDVIGDRWTLLIVRELLISPRRHGELKAALPGIATNLLGDRLQQLVVDGVAVREEQPGRKAVVYRLTGRGQQLRGPVLGLVGWGAQLMSSGPRPGDSVQPQWLALALEAMLGSASFTTTGSILLTPSDAGGVPAQRGPAAGSVVLRVGPAGATIRAAGTSRAEATANPDTGPDADPNPDAADATIVAPSAVILGLFAGAISPRSPLAALATIDDPGQLVATTLASAHEHTARLNAG